CLPYELLPRRHFEEPLRRSNPDCLRGKSLDCFAKLAMTKSGALYFLRRSAPAQTVSAERVMYLAFALARNATAVAMSSVAPYRPSAMNCFNVSAVGPLAGFMSVSIEPGW